MVTWGTSPDQATTITAGSRPRIRDRSIASSSSHSRLVLYGAASRRAAHQHRHQSRLHRLLHQFTHRGLRDAARVLTGRKVAAGVRVLVVPGSSAVRAQAESEGIAAIFEAAGFEWRQSGCSMCLAMNDECLRLATGALPRPTAISRDARARGPAPTDEPRDGRRCCGCRPPRRCPRFRREEITHGAFYLL